MTYLQNLHTHSTYDDGKDSLEKMVEIAVKKCGFNEIYILTKYGFKPVEI